MRKATEGFASASWSITGDTCLHGPHHLACGRSSVRGMITRHVFSQCSLPGTPRHAEKAALAQLL